jgi:GTP pyrophosphokinase
VEVAWGAAKSGASYAVDLRVIGSERAGLLRDVTEIFSKEKVPVRGVQQQVSHKGGKSATWITLTVEIQDASALAKVLAAVAQLSGVESARRV